MELETPRFGGALFAIVTVVLAGLASACFGIALSQQVASSGAGIVSVSEARAAAERAGQTRVNRGPGVDAFAAAR